jgi:hypothetical protein
MLSRQQVLDLYFLEARGKLIDIAAFMDRVERAGGEADFRWAAFKRALNELDQQGQERARSVLMALSDHSTDPIPSAINKAACGAWPQLTKAADH